MHLGDRKAVKVAEVWGQRQEEIGKGAEIGGAEKWVEVMGDKGTIVGLGEVILP